MYFQIEIQISMSCTQMQNLIIQTQTRLHGIFHAAHVIQIAKLRRIMYM